ncbi:MAG TPA: ATP-binding cassette domain-containing protein, partial [Myxococcota bacterium]
MIAIDGLTKRYGATEALRGISFEVPKGQVVGFLGPNGAGKSTT